MVMKCREVKKYLNTFLIEKHDEEQHSEVIEHIVNCPRCAREYEVARKTLISIQLSRKITPSADMKQRIMNDIRDINETNLKLEKSTFGKIIHWKPAWAVGAAVFLLVIASILISNNQKKNNRISRSLLSSAWAAEEAVFSGNGVVHIVNEIIVKPISNSVLSQRRWYPVISIEATGKSKFHQLSLPAEPGEHYTVNDEAWFDNDTGKFIRLFSVDGIPVFANSYDGDNVYSLEAEANGNWQIIGKPIGEEFNPPENPADFLGIAAGLTSKIDEKDEKVMGASDGKLQDGSNARFIKIGLESSLPFMTPMSYWIYKIRTSDKTIAEKEWIVNKESLMVVRRVTTGAVDSCEVQWNLAGMDNLANASLKPPKAVINPDMIVLNVPIQHMTENADYETYIFASGPPWTEQYEITDILDIVSPPHRMFSIIYRAEDGRHVVLIQAHTFNKFFGHITKISKLKYTSPNGFKVWSGIQNKWMAKIFLDSSRSIIKDPPSKDRTGYILESPDGTFPCIAINGELSDNEFRNLIDNLLPAKEYKDK
ncbi:anti-sigma factor family protein [Candidatus Latescibacterota bacterium]